MPTGYYLLDNPNRTPQCRTPRRSSLSGTVGVHTCESLMDDVGPDTGAENVASFIARRSDYGSYHVIVDSDSVVPMAPDSYETWHIAESDAYGKGMNWHSWGISAACQAATWDPDDDWTKRTITRMGAQIRAFWVRNGFNPDDPRICRWLTRDEAKRHVPGLVLHGVVQPSDRSDAWARHPQRHRLDQMLIDAIRRGTTEQEDIMATLAELEAVVNKAADRIIEAVDKPRPDPSIFLASHETEQKGYLVINFRKRHLTPEQYAVFEGIVPNLGFQGRLLDAIPNEEA